MNLEEFLQAKVEMNTSFSLERVQEIYKKLEPLIKAKDQILIHILGTNAKGSTGRFIAQSIHESNNTIFHFTSPHIFSFKERFYKNGKIIDSKSLEQAHKLLYDLEFTRHASYFEWATLLALVLSRDCKYVVLEAGLGGEKDSTSILEYDISVYTRIGLDHMQILGDTIEQIASTKLKAMSGEVFTHFLDEEVKDIALSIAKQKNLKINFLESSHIDEEILIYQKTYLYEDFLMENLALANNVLKKLNIKILKNRLNLRARFEKLQSNLYIDVGHNEMAAKNISNILRKITNKKIILIYNSYKDKDIKSILKHFKDIIKKVQIFPLSDNKRLIPKKDLEDLLNLMQMPHESFTNTLSKDEIYLVFGSFYLVEAFLTLYDNKKIINA